MADLALKRGAIRGKLTRLETFVNKLLQNAETGISVKSIDILQLRKRLVDAESLLKDFEEIQLAIQSTAEDIDPEYLIEQEFEDKYYGVISVAEEFLEKYGGGTSSVPGSAHNSVALGESLNGSDSGSINGSNRAFVRLPTINLPSFSGKPEEWLNFRDLFASLIDSNSDLTDVQKLHYLRGSLTAKAAETIKGLNISSANYKVAWDGLNDRYNNSRALRFYHIKEIFSLESISKECSSRLRNLVDSLKRNLRCLDSLIGQEEQRESFLIYILQSKLDSTTNREFENQADPSKHLSLDDLISFVERKASLLETIEQRNQKPVHNSISRSFVATAGGCPLCSGPHCLFACNQFKRFDVKERQVKAKNLRVCFNCLSKGHFTKNCKSKFTCNICKSKHHSLLHEDVRDNQPTEPKSTQASRQLDANFSAFASNQTGALLPTVLVRISDVDGKEHQVRALLDSGSMSSFISSNLRQKLKLSKKSANVQLQGITSSYESVTSRCNVVLCSTVTNFSMEVNCLVIPRVVGRLPSATVYLNGWEIPPDLQLADPNFNVPSDIDILLGANHFWTVLRSGRISLGKSKPILHNTHFGWIVSGPLPFVGPGSSDLLCNFTSTLNVDDSLRRFWELEEVPSSSKLLSDEELDCESHFKNTIKRDPSGRFIASIPLKQDPIVLGDSFEQSRRRFLNLERKLTSNHELRERYSKFMEEYERLGHMSAVSNPDDAKCSFFLPHHGVLKESSLTTKLRVVFDGSAPSSTGVSLNDIQKVGPVIQSDLFSILIRFRQYAYVFSADIEKMYRQILITDEQRPLQRILWRPNPELPLTIYNLNTVTYGTSSASFLATRCLQQVGIECASSHPVLSEIIQRHFYVDDWLSGSNSLIDCQELCTLLSKTLSASGFPLRKWLSNDPLVLEKIDPSHIHPQLHDFGSTAKTLGLLWSNNSDELLFYISEKISGNLTKRSLLSDISQIFDPLGLLSPCVMNAKFILQALWLEKISWDDPIPPLVAQEWSTLKHTLPELNEMRFPRNVLCENSVSISLHGFSDASIKGYGACVYIRSVNAEGETSCNLLCSKGRVAPLKYVSIPRMELCGALTLARLAKQITSILHTKIDNAVFWTDSTIVLSWLKMPPNRLKVFVANRVQEIQELFQNACWRHVPGKDNPADMISRGALPSEIINSGFWIHGPEWLIQPESHWPNSNFDIFNVPELKSEVIAQAVVEVDRFPISNFSNLSRLKRVVAYCLRFASNCPKPKRDRQLGSLSLHELKTALNALIKASQNDTFAEELDNLGAGRPLSRSSKLSSLHPFLDDHEVLRVGGRLENSSYDFDKRHPAVISSKHPLAKLIVVHEHQRLLHAGPQLVLSALRERYWITSGRNLVKRVVHSCVKCFRFCPKTTTPIMGHLPAPRVEESPPFQHTGIDYAGPFLLKDRKSRGCKMSKCYICLFVCFATKAVHLELVSDLSAEVFIQALRRFVSRRGLPGHVYSDNGSNFVGANSRLRELGQFLKKDADSISKFAAENNIHWHFTPGYSPHFGGLWEAGVKSSKHHLRRIVGNAALTFEEFCTLLCQVESILNSRPLTPLSSEPTDLEPLTPGHFLIGRPMTSVPDSDFLDSPPNRLSRFEHIQQMSQHFWRRWSREYIGELQQRTKWRDNSSDLKLGSLVLIKHDNLPPMKWQLGRVIEVHPGKDGVNRVASVQTNGSVVRRSFPKLCPLPIQAIS